MRVFWRFRVAGCMEYSFSDENFKREKDERYGKRRKREMKIKEVNTYYVRPRWGFVEMVTDDGYIGWGEAVLEGHVHAVLSCVEEMKDYLEK